MWFSCDITYNSPEISIKCRHLNHSTSISVGFFQTHYRLQSASPWWHTGRRKRWRRETLRFGFLFPMGSMGTICIFTYMEWLICHGQLQVVEKFTSPIDPIWVWEMVHFMIGRILMVNDMLRSFLLVFFFFGGGDGYRFAICYLRYVEWYIYICFFFPLSEAKDMNSITHWGPVLLFGCQGDQRGIWWTVDGWHLRDTWNKLIPIRWSGKTCSWSSRWEDGGLLGLLLLLYKDNN